jgi:hypothetical protein
VSEAASERDSTLQEAQDLADRLEKLQSERDQLKLVLESSQVQVDELQFQLDEINTRWVGGFDACLLSQDEVQRLVLGDPDLDFKRQWGHMWKSCKNGLTNFLSDYTACAGLSWKSS